MRWYHRTVKNMAKKKAKHKCDGCVWRVYATENKVLCMFSKCVREEYKTMWPDNRGNSHEKKKPD